MALKGTTKIELTNVKTGEVEVIEKDNLVTSAVPSIVSDNPFAWQFKSNNGSNYFAGNIFPLCLQLFGGILLYEDAIPEDANQLYAQSTNKLVGYSTGNVNDTTDIMRGSLNPNESGALETNDGYRYVFDFTTSQANGTISSVGLTSKWGGVAGNGSIHYKNTQSPCVYSSQHDVGDKDIAYAYTTLLHYDADTGIATSMYVSGQNMITVTRIQLHTKAWKLTRYMNLVDATQVVDTQIIETQTFAGTSVSGGYLNYNLCDGGDGYIWGFEHAANANGNSADSASINWIKIKLDDLSFEEGTWSINGQLYSMGTRYNGIASSWNYRYNDRANCVVLDGYLYCFNYGLTGVYKINLSNPTDITFIEHPDKKILLYSSGSIGGSVYYYYYYSTANLAVAGNRVCMWNGWINGDTIVPNTYNVGIRNSYADLGDGWCDGSDVNSYPYRNSCGLCGIKIGVFLLYFSAYRQSSATVSDVRANLLLNSPYLATINNLATPVQKTADKTMKITYILREEITDAGV